MTIDRTQRHITDNLNEFEVYEESPDHHFRTEIPNIIFELGLSPETFCVYAHLKRIAGDRGACFKSNKNLAKDCNMSETKLRDCLKELSELQIFIGDDILPEKKEIFHDELRLVKITRRKKVDGGWDTNLITITPLWRLNGDVMRSRIKKKIGTSRDEGGVPRGTREGTSRDEDKEEPSKRKPLEESASEKAPPPIENSFKESNNNSEKENALIEECQKLSINIPPKEIQRWIKYYGIKYTGRTIAKCFHERNLLSRSNQTAFVQSALSEDFFGYQKEKDTV